MNRRIFFVSILATTMMPVMALAADFVDYEPGIIETALEDGKTVFVDYSARWCGTCKRQERVINALRVADPAYDNAMTFVKVDWDTYKNHEVAVFRDIPRRSTLLVLRGEQELGRVVAGTSESQIKALMDSGL
ncbi:thioredoxin [Sulfitobacter sp. SK012]|uniref:thioredoxin family protein n=1 Tax=Sulfitobacter sp. SK012 TaxID=1389005 RepID=UPI000E0A1782|nr:thioredoxin family protein [Sulfitobacter sp. SK012]AXI47202.1 thioredoxin [Sulfitobacter sp. SK012]